jgi:hypothetical protein
MKTPVSDTIQRQNRASKSEKNKGDNSQTITLLPDNFRNELFDQNLLYFKKHQSELYNVIIKHKCKEYHICSNSEGNPNILHMPTKTLLYSASTMSENITSIHKQIDKLSFNSQIQANFVNSADERWKHNNPIQVKMMDRLYKSGIFCKMKVSGENLTPLDGYSTDYLPLIRVYGIGLGYHLTELIKKKKISYITVYEPHLDLFYTSLYTIPWQLIFKYFEGKGKGINLVLTPSPDSALDSSMAFIKKNLVSLTTLFYRFPHFNNNPAIKEIIKNEPQKDSVQKEASDAGWYEDQRSGFYHGARNIKKGTKFFTGQKVKHYCRVFIVGSGPSLNESIDYIKKFQNEAIIISCGSAITPLLKAGIIPDYEVVQERNWHTFKYEERYDQKSMKKITLLKLNVVSPTLDRYYKETLVFQKFNDPGSSFLGNDYAVTTAVNPTVTNAGISMAAELGAKEAYLFGVDYGAPKESEKMHASNTIYDDGAVDDSGKSETCHDLPGNLGETIRTTTLLSWSHKTTESRIALHPDIQWFNVGEGALISGTTPVSINDLPLKFSRKIQKQNLREEVSSCFNNQYNPQEVLKRLRTEHMQQVEQYFQALLQFTDSFPQTREEIINVLSLLHKAVSIGHNQTHFLPSSLLSSGFKQFINNVYIQTALEPDDTSAASFFASAKNTLIEYVNDIRKDLVKILEYIDLDSETEIFIDLKET